MSTKPNPSQTHKKPWPTKDAMEQVYARNLWGGDTAVFYSGEGSHHREIITPYIDAVISFLKTFKEPLKVCDLGCGDFNVGKELVPYTKNYVAVDIVPDLIVYNKATFKGDTLEFLCLDIAVDDLPTGDCALVRQVLQHLSNAEIQKILLKLSSYKYVIITEHIPEGTFIPNIDIISGQGTRLKKKSGIKLLQPPFYFKVKEERELTSIFLKDGNGIITTTLYKTL